MKIRRYKESDNKFLGEIYDLCRPDEFYGELGQHKIVRWFDEPFIQDNLSQSSILVAEVDGKIVGFCGSRNNHIYWLFVLPEHREKGIAKKLINEVVRQMNGKITLLVWSSNQKARMLYQSCGFELSERKLVDYYGKPLSLDSMVLER